jgi:hypothetical protein
MRDYQQTHMDYCLDLARQELALGKAGREKLAVVAESGGEPAVLEQRRAHSLSLYHTAMKPAV